MYRWRWLVFLIFFPLYSVFLNLFARLFRKKAWFRESFQGLIRFWGKFIAWSANITIDLSEEDRKKLFTSKSRVIICNHRSYLDSIVIWSIIPKGVNLCYAAKKELFKTFIYGRLLEANESIVINRKNPKEAMASLRQAFVRDDVPRSLLVYAEGTRNNKTNTLLPFKHGPFVLASESNVGMLPIVLKGADKALPVGSKLPIPTVVEVKILDEVKPKVLHEKGVDTVRQELWQEMKDIFDK